MSKKVIPTNQLSAVQLSELPHLSGSLAGSGGVNSPKGPYQGLLAGGVLSPGHVSTMPLRPQQSISGGLVSLGNGSRPEIDDDNRHNETGYMQYWKFKFAKGFMVKSSRVGIRNKSINVSDTMTMILDLLFYNFTRLPNIVAAVKLVVLYFTHAYVFDIVDPVYYLVFLIISLLLNILIFFIFYSPVRMMTKRWNHRKISKLKRVSGWVQAEVSTLMIGDIVRIDKNAICPADMLILDSSDSRLRSKVVLVNESKITGVKKVSRKRPISEIVVAAKGMADDDIRNNLTGYIEYLEPSFLEQSTIGIFKLKGDPKVVQIKPSNIVYCGSKIVSDHILGMILYTGNDSRIFKLNNLNSNLLRRSRSIATSVSKIIDKVSLFFLCIGLYAGLFMVLYYENNSDEQVRNELIEWIAFSQEPYWIKFVRIVTVTCSVVPFYLVIMEDIIYFVAALLEQTWKIPEADDTVGEDTDTVWNGQGGQLVSQPSEITPVPENVYFPNISPGSKFVRNKYGRFNGFNNNRSLTPNRSQLNQRHDSSSPEHKTYSGILGTTPMGSDISNPFRFKSLNARSLSIVPNQNPALDHLESNAVLATARSMGIISKIFNLHKTLGNLQKNASLFNISIQSWVKISNSRCLGDLGSISHVVFDKTGTLSESKVEIVFFSTWKLSYKLEFEKMRIKLEEFKKNPENYRHEPDKNDLDVKQREDDFYSEKSQEYEKELNHEFDSRMFREDSELDDMFDKVQAPYFFPVKVDEFSEVSRKNSITPYAHEGPSMGEPEESVLASARQISYKDRDNSRMSFNDDLLISPKHLQNLTVDKIDLLFNKTRKQTIQLLPVEDEHKDSLSQTIDEDENKVTEKVNTFQSQMAFFFDNHAKNDELDAMISSMVLFLYCGMSELKSKYTPSLPNKATNELLSVIGVRISQVSLKESASNWMNYQVRIQSDLNKIMRTYTVYGVNPKSLARDRTSIVVSLKGSSDDQYFILVRGDQLALRGCLDLSPEEQTHIRNLMVQYKELRLNRIMYAYRRITAEELKIYVNGYNLMLNSKRYDNAGIDRLAAPLETNLRFQGCLGMILKTKPEAGPLISTFKSAEIPVSLLSGDNYENTINVVKGIKMANTNFNDKSSYFSLTFDNIERGVMDMHAYLEIVYHHIKARNNAQLNHYMKYLMNSKSTGELNNLANSGIIMDLDEAEGAHDSLDQSKQFKRNMVISGKALDLIQQDIHLEKLFKILFIFTKGVFGYDMRPSHKGYLVNCLRDQDELVLAIGDGLNDLGMMSAANISIQVAHPDIPLFFGDIIVNRLDIIQKLIFHKGFSLLKSTRLSFMFALLTFSKYFAANVWYFTLSNFTSRVVGPIYIHLLVIIILIDVVFRTSTHKVYSDRLLSMAPIIYQESRVQETKLASMIFTFILVTTFEVIFVFSVNYGYFSSINFGSGKPVDHEFQLAFIFFAFFMNGTYMNFKFFCYDSRFRYVTLLVLHVILGCFAVYHVLARLDTVSSISLTSMLSNSYSISCMLIVVLVPTYVNYIFVTMFIHKIMHPVRHFLMNTLRRGKDWAYIAEEDVDTLRKIKRIVKKLTTSGSNSIHNTINRVSRTVKLYKTQTTITDSIVLKLLLINIHQFKIGFNQLKNKIIDLRDRKKFVIVNMATHVNYTKFILSLCSLMFGLEIFIMIVVSKPKDVPIYIFTAPNIYKLVLTLITVGLMFKKSSRRDGFLVGYLGLMLILSVLVELVIFFIDVFNNSEDERKWLYSQTSSRMVSSALPLGFTASLSMIFLLDFIAVFRITYLASPISSAVNIKVHLVIVGIMMGALMALKCSLKKKYDKTCKINFLSVNKLKHEIAKSKEKLSMLMPKFVWDKINTEGFSESFAADDAGEVTILFCDISDFDSVISMCGEKIVDILDELFRIFDTLCKKHNVQKIETVGKTYMACGGLKFLEGTAGSNKNYSERVVDLAIDMIRCVQSQTFEMGVRLMLKIGVHHGNCTYGVIGYHKPQFSLMGDTVNTTSRHCTTGDPGSIVLSVAAYNRLDASKYPEVKRRVVQMKGKGDVEVFMINVKAFGQPQNIFDIMKESHGSNRSLQEPTARVVQSSQKLMSQRFINDTESNRMISSAWGGYEQTPKNRMEQPHDGPAPGARLISEMDEEAGDNPLTERHLLNEGNYGATEDPNRRAVALPQKSVDIDQELEEDITIHQEVDDDLDVSDAGNELRNDQTDKITNIMKTFFGYVYGFRKEKRELEKFYNKQMRIKFKAKTRKTIMLITLLVFTQEVLIWVGYKTGEEDGFNLIRVAFFAWIFMSSIYLLLSSKVYKVIVVAIMFSKTGLYAADMYSTYSNYGSLSEKFNLTFYCLLYTCLIDSIFFISVGIFPVMELLMLNLVSFLMIFINTLIFKARHDSVVSIMFTVVIFFVFNVVDIVNHFDTELTTFFNFIKIEQRSYYLVTFVDRLLPKHLKGVGNSGTERYENVTLLFADIVGFTEYSAGKNPRQVVEMLSQLFTAFDKECNKLNLYKLYTIGDCYVVMGFLDKYNRKTPREEANDVVQLAMFMIKTIQRVRTKINFDKLNMRIGVHTGTVFGGVIGTDIVRFDLYGPDVLTANKMESGGEPGRINISETTKQLLDELDSTNFTFEPNKQIEIKLLNRKYWSYFLNYQDEK